MQDAKMSDNVVYTRGQNAWRKWLVGLLLSMFVGLNGISVYNHTTVRGNFSGLTFAYSVPTLEPSTNVYFAQLDQSGLAINRLYLSSWELSDDGRYLFQYSRIRVTSPWYLQKFDLSTGRELCHAFQDKEKPKYCTSDTANPAEEIAIEAAPAEPSR